MQMLSFTQFLLEASTGVEKWNKYFANKPNNVLTKIKHSDYLYTLDGQKTSEEIDANTEITVYTDQDYSSKPKISYNDTDYRIPFKSIEKPIQRKVSFQLKPDKFNIPERTSLKNYYNTVIEKIFSNNNLTSEIKDYLGDLIGYCFDKTSKDDVKVSFEKTNPDAGFINTINNDFMEIIGPIVAADELSLSEDVIIFFPSKGNEEMLDFKIIDDDKEYIFSSKTSAKKHTNLLSPKNVLSGLKDKKIDKSFLDVLKIISTAPVKKCPLELAKYFGIDHDITTVDKLLKLEKLMISKLNDMGTDKWTNIVQQAVSDLYIVKLHIDKNGLPILDSSLKKGEYLEKVIWRSKNSPNHWDRIGLQL